MLYRKVCLLILSILFISMGAFAQNYFWVGFANKKGTVQSLSNASALLSPRAIQRRARQNIPVDSLDLPVSATYTQKVKALGATLVNSSRWLNGITVKTVVDTFETAVKKFPFVKEVQLTKPATAAKSGFNKFETMGQNAEPEPIDATKYGNSVYQVGLFNGQYLHNKNIKGQGMVIAVLDAGYYNANTYSAFDSIRANKQILGVRDFINPQSNIYAEHNHGMNVLSCMAGNIPGQLIGTAPKASYWLLRSEEAVTEYIIEEDNWVCAAEFADSVGADVINTSLGYSEFEDARTNHIYKDLDGKTTRVTRGANIAASKGMLVFASAGNDGNNKWMKLSAPSDGDNVIAVGAVNKSGEPAVFTSHGPASDGDVKPNVSAVGWNTWLQLTNGSLGYSSGTSFSSPVMAGIGACLWQANPKATAFQVKRAIEQSAHLFTKPDTLVGYGIPDMKIADQLLKTLYTGETRVEENWSAYPNPFANQLVLKCAALDVPAEVNLSFFTAEGKLILQKTVEGAGQMFVVHTENLPTGIYILKIETDKKADVLKIVKNQ